MLRRIPKSIGMTQSQLPYISLPEMDTWTLSNSTYQETLEEDISSFKVTNDTTPLHCALHNHRINVLEFYLDYYQEKIFFLNVLNELEPSSTKIMYELDLQLPGDLFLQLLKEFDVTGHYFLQIRYKGIERFLPFH